MSALRAILDRLNDVESAIAQIEGNARPENALAYRLTLQSLENRRNSFRDELAELTEREFIEVCDYRIIPGDKTSYAVSAVTAALHDFQDLVTLLFSSGSSKKARRRAPGDPTVSERTRFDFGFSYAGSLGIVLTIPNERLIAMDSDLDAAVKKAFDLISAKSKEQIQAAAVSFGAPVIRKLYSWSKTQRDYNLSADIKWTRGKTIRSETLVQAKESAEVCQIIEAKTDLEQTTHELTGTLVGYNVKTRRFEIELPDEEFVSGEFSKAFDAIPKRSVPARYEARLTRRAVVNYASDFEKVTWLLEGLSELK